MEIREEIPTNHILINVMTPDGHPVRVVPTAKYIQMHRNGFSAGEGRFCCIQNNEVRTSVNYDYEEVIPVTMENYQTAVKKCRP